MLEIGGPDVVTYEEMMHLYADVAGLGRRIVIPVPVLTPRLSSYWVGLVTPLPIGLARPLIESLENEVVMRDDTILRLLPRERIPLRAGDPARDGAALAMWRSRRRGRKPSSSDADPRIRWPPTPSGRVASSSTIRRSS